MKQKFNLKKMFSTNPTPRGWIGDCIRKLNNASQKAPKKPARKHGK